MFEFQVFSIQMVTAYHILFKMAFQVYSGILIVDTLVFTFQTPVIQILPVYSTLKVQSFLSATENMFYIQKIQKSVRDISFYI